MMLVGWLAVVVVRVNSISLWNDNLATSIATSISAAIEASAGGMGLNRGDIFGVNLTCRWSVVMTGMKGLMMGSTCMRISMLYICWRHLPVSPVRGVLRTCLLRSDS